MSRDIIAGQMGWWGYLYLSGWMSLCLKTDSQPPRVRLYRARVSSLVAPGQWRVEAGQICPVRILGATSGEERAERREVSHGDIARDPSQINIIATRQRWSLIMKFTFRVYILSTNFNFKLCHQSIVLEQISQDVCRFCPKSRWWFTGHVKGQKFDNSPVSASDNNLPIAPPWPGLENTKFAIFHNFNPRPTYSSVNCLWQHLQR